MKYDFEAWIERHRLSAAQGGALVALAFHGPARWQLGPGCWTIVGATWGQQTLKSLVRRFLAQVTTPTLIEITPVGRAAIDELQTGSPGVKALDTFLRAARGQ